jgi:hypothetical protein
MTKNKYSTYYLLVSFLILYTQLRLKEIQNFSFIFSDVFINILNLWQQSVRISCIWSLTILIIGKIRFKIFIYN